MFFSRSRTALASCREPWTSVRLDFSISPSLDFDSEAFWFDRVSAARRSDSRSRTERINRTLEREKKTVAATSLNRKIVIGFSFFSDVESETAVFQKLPAGIRLIILSETKRAKQRSRKQASSQVGKVLSAYYWVKSLGALIDHRVANN